MATDETPAADKRIQPHHLVIGLGVAIGLFSALSGVAPLITKWEDDSPIGRPVFYNIPSAVKLAFYIVIPLLIVYGAYLFAQRVKNWERGTPDNRATTPKNAKRRFESFRSGVYM